MNKIDLLSKVSIFSYMAKEDLERIAEQARLKRFERGDVIIKEGARDHFLFIVISGRVDAVRDLGSNNEKILGTLGPLAYFGEMALIDDLARSASVVAKEDTQVLCLEQLDLQKEIKAHPAMALELLRMLSRRLRLTEKFVINTLGSFLPICANCKKIREKDDSWVSIEAYVRDHSETEFSHGICPDCLKKLYPEYYPGE